MSDLYINMCLTEHASLQYGIIDLKIYFKIDCVYKYTYFTNIYKYREQFNRSTRCVTGTDLLFYVR